MKRSRRHRDEWQRLVRDWSVSGESVEEFARRKSLPEGRLRWWAGRLGGRSGTEVPSSAPSIVPVQFIEVPPAQIAARESRGDGVEVTLQNGRRLAFGAGVEIGRLTEIVRVLEER